MDKRCTRTRTLSDVLATQAQDENILLYNGGASRYEPVAKTSLLSIGDLTNVASTSPTSGQVLGWNGNTWTPQTVSNATLAGLTDVNAIGVQNDNILVYNSTTSQWEAENKANITTLGALSNVSSMSPNDGDVLAYNSFASEWQPTTLWWICYWFECINRCSDQSAIAGETLVYDSLTGNFENQTIPGGSVSGLRIQYYFYS